jgi:hypothetical protein
MSNKFNPKVARVVVAGWAVAFIATAIVIQAPYALQHDFAKSTAWLFERGWQNEIAAFDLCLGLIAGWAVWKGVAQSLLAPFGVLGALLGTNHLVAAMDSGHSGNWIGAGANAVGLLGLGLALVCGRRDGQFAKVDT